MALTAITGAAAAAPVPVAREFPTPEQMERLRVLMRGRPTQGVQLFPRPFDLPRDYLMAVFTDGFTLGIDPDGRASS